MQAEVQELPFPNGKEAMPKNVSPKPGIPHVIIVGSGFGGLEAAKSLAHAPVRVTIIDRHNYHLFRPMLYQVATGLLTAEEISAPIRSILHGQKNVDVLLGEVSGVDTGSKRVLMGHNSLPYDFLILATGIHYNYFGHDAWQEVAPSLNNAEDAAHIRSRIFSAFETAERLTADAQADDAEAQADPGLLTGWMTFALVGGGATGVEMAGAMAELARKSLASDFRHIDPRRASILIVRGRAAHPGRLPRRLGGAGASPSGTTRRNGTHGGKSGVRGGGRGDDERKKDSLPHRHLGGGRDGLLCREVAGGRYGQKRAGASQSRPLGAGPFRRVCDRRYGGGRRALAQHSRW